MNAAAGATLAGRRVAESLMQDTCRLRRRTGEQLDDASLALEPVFEDLYVGRCRVDTTSAGEPEHTAGESGERQVFQQRRTVKVPASVTGVDVGDEVLVLTSALDPDLPGRTFLVLAVEAGTHLTARRLTVQERTS